MLHGSIHVIISRLQVQGAFALESVEVDLHDSTWRGESAPVSVAIMQHSAPQAVLTWKKSQGIQTPHGIQLYLDDHSRLCVHTKVTHAIQHQHGPHILLTRIESQHCFLQGVEVKFHDLPWIRDRAEVPMPLVHHGRCKQWKLRTCGIYLHGFQMYLDKFVRSKVSESVVLHCRPDSGE